MKSESPREVDVEFFRQHGYFVLENVLDFTAVDALRQAIAQLPDVPQVRRKSSIYGVRNLFSVCPLVRALAGSSAVRRLVTPILGEKAFAVRATFFDKVPGANWSLFWHQDNVINVAERAEVPGFIAWSKKAGVWHVQPPAEVLANMVAVRLHLDDCPADNGPLRVIPGTHRHGWLEGDLNPWKKSTQEVVCTTGTGGAVLMCPLLLHASLPASTTRVSHRRVIHLEFANQSLSAGLRWFEQVGANANP